jgi:hypothetical protein
MEVLRQPVWPVPRVVVVLLLLAALGVALYGLFGRPRGWNFMEEPFGDRGWMYGWPVSHLVLFFALGLAAPRHWFVIWAAGLAWELIEFGAGRMLARYEYWYSIRFDVVLNTVGLAVGATLGTLLRAWRLRRKQVPASAAMFIVAATVAVILLFANDSWTYTLDRTLRGDAKSRNEAFVKACGVTHRCASAAAPIVA